jgi:hypothetical protein
VTETQRTPRHYKFQLMSGEDEGQDDGPLPEAPARSEAPSAVAKRRARRAVVKQIMDGTA